MSRTRINLKSLSLDRLETLSGIVAQGGIARAAGGDANRQSLFSRQVAALGFRNPAQRPLSGRDGAFRAEADTDVPAAAVGVGKEQTKVVVEGSGGNPVDPAGG